MYCTVLYGKDVLWLPAELAAGGFGMFIDDLFSFSRNF